MQKTPSMSGTVEVLLENRGGVDACVHFNKGDLVLRLCVAENLAASAFGISGGVLNNIVMSRLYCARSVACVSTSGGMSNKLNDTTSKSSSGVFEGVAIGGKRELGSRFFFW